MQREIQLTEDGSHTIFIPEMKVAYHSHHGAIAESGHVYINAGLQPLLNLPNLTLLTIFEMGFGTGLNALLSLQEATKYKRLIHYTAIELYPLAKEEIALLNYGNLLSRQDDFLKIHDCDWEKDSVINEYFTICKKKISLTEMAFNDPFHCIYFDAFAPTVQPALWTKEVFEKMYHALLPGGSLVTYSSKSEVRRAMADAGFLVEKIPGPRGKREMVRAWK